MFKIFKAFYNWFYSVGTETLTNLSETQNIELNDRNDFDVLDYSAFPQLFGGSEFYEDEPMFV